MSCGVWYFYMLCHKECGATYVGHSKNIKRIYGHKYEVNNATSPNYNSKKSVAIRNMGGFEQFNYIIIETIPMQFMCSNGAKWHERYLINKYNATLNTNTPILTSYEKKERDKSRKRERYRNDKQFRELKKTKSVANYWKKKALAKESD